MVERSLESAAPASHEDSAPELALVVGAARSGTTLLRLLLDAHPDIGCPAEAGIPALIKTLGRVWWTIDADVVDDRGGDPLTTEEAANSPVGAANNYGIRPEMARLPELSSLAKAAVREAVLGPIRHYCQREGKKRIYCAKSLDSVHHLDAVRDIFPEARYVLLFRHVMDTVASGIEASPWGFHAYGYLPFVQRSPDNFVAALASYWLSHVDAALGWQEAHPHQCHLVRYEDLVSDPATVIAEICSFLGVEPDPTVLARAFARARSAQGPGDYKVTYTSSVHGTSVGHGKRVPVHMLPSPLLDAVNAKLAALGYEPLNREWNTAPNARLRAGEETIWSLRLRQLMEAVEPPAPNGNAKVGSFAIVADDHPDLRWVIDPAAGEIRQGDGEVESVVTGTVEDLVLMAAEEENVGVLLRSGRIRHLTAREDMPPDAVASEMNSVLDMLRARRHTNGGQPVLRR